MCGMRLLSLLFLSVACLHRHLADFSRHRLAASPGIRRSSQDVARELGGKTETQREGDINSHPA